MIFIPESLIILRDDSQSQAFVGKGSDLLLRLGFLGTLETDDKRDGHLELLSRLDDTLCDVVTAHDTTENVDEDGFDVLVSKEQLERLLDGFGSSTSTEVIRNSICVILIRILTRQRQGSSLADHRAKQGHPWWPWRDQHRSPGNQHYRRA
jgi:hypothetical protein